MTLLLPRVDPRIATKLRTRYLADSKNRAFDSQVLDSMYHHRVAFPATGGIRVTLNALIELRNECSEAQKAAELAPNTEQSFDLRLGEILTRFGTSSRNEFGIGAVWDFLTLILLPDIVSNRLGKISAESLGSRSRITGGDRRHQLQRLWRRRIVLGAELVDSRLLTEDDYVQLLERNITLERPELTQRVARKILTSGLSGQDRRNYTRSMMKSVLQMSGIVHFSGNDTAHLDVAIEELHQWTISQLGDMKNLNESITDDYAPSSEERLPTTARKK